MLELLKDNAGLVLILIAIAVVVLPRLNIKGWLAKIGVTSDKEHWKDSVEHFECLVKDLEEAEEHNAVKALKEQVWPALGNLVWRKTNDAQV